MTAFMLNTEDAAWIARNNPVHIQGHRYLISVDAVEHVTFCGQEWIRTVLNDLPRDHGNRNVMCPIAWLTS